jgi:hypothetical protein
MSRYSSAIWSREMVVCDNRDDAKVVHHVLTTSRRELISIGAFPAYRGVHPYFHLTHRNDYERHYAATDRAIGFPVREHASVADFYEAIGWDPKTKRWKETPTVGETT